MTAKSTKYIPMYFISSTQSRCLTTRGDYSSRGNVKGPKHTQRDLVTLIRMSSHSILWSQLLNSLCRSLRDRAIKRIKRALKNWPMSAFERTLKYILVSYRMHTHTYRLTALCPGLPGWAGTRKVKPIWILLKQETMSGSGISWAICKSAPRAPDR